jgi:catalase
MTEATQSVIASWREDWRDALPVRTPDEQARLREEARRAVADLQAAARRVEGRAGRALHRRPLHVTAHARLEVSPDVPAPIALGPFVPGASWPALVRLSSAYPVSRSDSTPDQRGLAARIVDGARRLDLLATTGEAHHARDARAMIASLAAARAAVRGGLAGRLGALATLVRALGLADALRIARTVSRAAEAGASLASLTFFSRAPFGLGPFAVRYRFAPLAGVDPAIRTSGDDALGLDLAERRRAGEVAWHVQVQGFLDRERTPLDDHRTAWRSPWVTVGRLVLAAEVPADDGETPIGFRATPAWPDAGGPVLEPLGDLNALRAAAYAESARGRDADAETAG